MVAREGGPGTDEGLTLFGAFVWTPLQRINTLPYFAAAGASYRGLLPSRGQDTATVAVYYGGFSGDLPGQTHEVTLEWTYAVAVTPWLTVQPDVQYVIRPDGRSSIPNALVVGIQIALRSAHRDGGPGARQLLDDQSHVGGADRGALVEQSRTGYAFSSAASRRERRGRTPVLQLGLSLSAMPPPR
jgi:hypothetical protein